MSKFRLVLGGIFLLMLGISAFYLGNQLINKNKKQACTQEAKICPDGSTVSRTGPNCEFAPCSQISPNPVSNKNSWKTYNDPKFKFQIQYPSTMNYLVSNRKDGLYLGGVSFMLNYEDSELHYQSSEIYIWVFNSFGMTLDDWLLNNSSPDPFGTTEKEFHGFKNLGSASIGGIEGIQFEWEAFGYISTAVAVKREEHIYVVGNAKTSDDLSTIYKEMLPTFQFLYQNQTKNTADWKTFYDTTGTFSVKHPSNFQVIKEHTIQYGNIQYGLDKLNWKYAGMIYRVDTSDPSEREDITIEFTLRTKEETESMTDFISRTVNENAGEFAPGDVSSKFKKNMTIADRKALWYEGNIGPAVPHVETFIPKDETTIVVATITTGESAITGKPYSENHKILIEEIFSTFQFL